MNSAVKQQQPDPNEEARRTAIELARIAKELAAEVKSLVETIQCKTRV